MRSAPHPVATLGASPQYSPPSLLRTRTRPWVGETETLPQRSVHISMSCSQERPWWCPRHRGCSPPEFGAPGPNGWGRRKAPRWGGERCQEVFRCWEPQFRAGPHPFPNPHPKCCKTAGEMTLNLRDPRAGTIPSSLWGGPPTPKSRKACPSPQRNAPE